MDSAIFVIIMFINIGIIIISLLSIRQSRRLTCHSRDRMLQTAAHMRAIEQNPQFSTEIRYQALLVARQAERGAEKIRHCKDHNGE